jgi:general secretion pathway protein A
VSFVPKSLARVHQFTGGIPRLINLLCDRTLLTAYSSRTNRVLPAAVASAATSLELARPSRKPAWLRHRLAPFAAGVLLAAMLGGGAAAMWHYRDYATVLMQRVASRQ